MLPGNICQAVASLTHGESVPRPLDLPLQVSHPALEQDVVALPHRLVHGPLAEVLQRAGGAAGGVEDA